MDPKKQALGVVLAIALLCALLLMRGDAAGQTYETGAPAASGAYSCLLPCP